LTDSCADGVTGFAVGAGDAVGDVFCIVGEGVVGVFHCATVVFALLPLPLLVLLLAPPEPPLEVPLPVPPLPLLLELPSFSINSAGSMLTECSSIASKALPTNNSFPRE
jgi:hypothetical protein